jgi:hypothetical protein
MDEGESSQDKGECASLAYFCCPNPIIHHGRRGGMDRDELVDSKATMIVNRPVHCWRTRRVSVSVIEQGVHVMLLVNTRESNVHV